MHELAVTESILSIALKHAEKASAKRVRGINLVIGQLSSIVDDSVQFYWDFIAKDTIAEGAILHFERISALMACLDCGHEYSPDRNDIGCPACGSVHIRIVRGEEFSLESIDIET